MSDAATYADLPVFAPPITGKSEESKVRAELLEGLLERFPVEHFVREGTDPYISPSQVKMAARCLEQYRRRYVKGEKEPPALNLAWGGSDHKAIELDFRGVLEGKPPLTASEAADLFVDCFEQRIFDDGGPAEIADWGFSGKDKGHRPGPAKAAEIISDVKKKGSALTAAYAQVVVPRVEPIVVEERFTLDVGLGVPIHGYIDLRGRDERLGGEEGMLERKLTAQNSVSGEWVTQGSMYQLVHPVPLIFDLSLRHTEPKLAAFEPEKHLLKPRPAEITVRQIRAAMVSIATCMIVYGPDQPWPDALTRIASPCSYCGWGPNASNRCFYHVGGVQ